jgi:UDP-N-acetylmuramoyl-tripeptide--D-alanyl-D-alanine ligase
MPNLRIIGVTGSYGKTSTKHYLYRILSEKYNVLMTPGSYNTPMGVIRTVREMMKPYYDVFIVEMGAKQLGDIKEICDLVCPTIGIVTAVGEQHLESFKSIENVQRTKFELVDALPADGLAVVNNDFEYIANRTVNNVPVKRYALAPGTDYHVEDVEYGEVETRFAVVGEGRRIELATKLVGDCNLSNLMASVIVALHLDVPEKSIRYGVSQIEQVEHRLNMKRTPGGLSIIDDAFNSNPDGARMALDVLSRIKTGKRIVITPGMIELGDKQVEYNKRLGVQMASAADYVMVVGTYNRDAILSGLAEGGMPEEKIFVADSFVMAQARLVQIARSGDVVLYENDLPDTFK